MAKRARGVGAAELPAFRGVCGVATRTTAWARYSSTELRTVPPASWPPITKTRDWTPRSAVAAPWLRRSVRPGLLNALQVPGPLGSGWKRCTGLGLATLGAPSEPVLPDTT